MGKILPHDPRWNANVQTVGDLKRAVHNVPDAFQVYTYGGEWSSYTLVRDIITGKRHPDDDRLAVVTFFPPQWQWPQPDLELKPLPPGVRSPAREIGSSKLPSVIREQSVSRVPPPDTRLSSNVLTVGELKRAIDDVGDDVEVYVYGGEMNTYNYVRCIVTDMRDVDHHRLAVVLFWEQYRPKPGEGFKQLPPGTRGVPVIDYVTLPWHIKGLLKLVHWIFS